LQLGERSILTQLGFRVHCSHPHKYMLAYAKVLELTGEQQLLQRAWNYLNDSYRSDVYIRYSAETIACAVLWMAARHTATPLPEKSPHQWWKVFGVTYPGRLSLSALLVLWLW
jgi:cyclin L